MIWLLISILTNTVLLLILKGFEKYGVNTLHGIVVNYLIAGSTGLALVGFPSGEVLSTGAHGIVWIPFVLGFLFISIFFILAKTAQVAGISVATVANKMSVVIPVTIAVILYNENIGWLKVIGMIAALIAVWLTSRKENAGSFDMKYALFPVLIFVGSGIIDALVNHLQQTIPDKSLIPFLLSIAFLTALLIGSCVIVYRFFRHREKITGKSILGGIILGIPNYFSIYAVTKALDANLLETSALYPVNNMGIVICSAIGATLIFREKLSLMNWGGILLSIAAIALIAFS